MMTKSSKNISSKATKRRNILITISVVITLLFGGFWVYTLDYYQASESVDVLMNDYQSYITKQGSYTLIKTSACENQDKAIVFYPGGKVEAKAYIPLLIQLADAGISSVLVDMPFNLAVFNINAANDAMKLFPNVSKWYMVGHSLGGAMASAYTNNHPEKVIKLILLGAYPTDTLDVPTLQIYGENDGVVDQSKMSEDVLTYVIEGGNHAYFGDYGEQDGDGIASILRESQQKQTVEQIMQFFQNP